MSHVRAHTPAAYADVSTATADALRPRVRIIDVREPAEFRGELGHIPGAELVPLASLTAAAHAWSRDEALIVVCRSGGRSTRAAEALIQLGFGRVHNMLGGMAQWRGEGRETER